MCWRKLSRNFMTSYVETPQTISSDSQRNVIYHFLVDLIFEPKKVSGCPT